MNELKKGSLSLSVNAIVVFVLAFAMLGFGLFLINKLQTTVDPIVDDIFTRDNWNPPPNSETPIQHMGTLEFKRGKDPSTIGLAFYNKEGSGWFQPKPELKCNPALLAGADNQIVLSSLPVEIGSGNWEAFEVRVKVGKLVDIDTYICNIGIQKSSNGLETGTYVDHAQKQYSIEVTS